MGASYRVFGSLHVSVAGRTAVRRQTTAEHGPDARERNDQGADLAATRWRVPPEPSVVSRGRARRKLSCRKCSRRKSRALSRPRSSRQERPPLAREDTADKPEAARAERAEDERLPFLERLPGRVADDASLRHEDGKRARRRLRAEKAPHRPDLSPPPPIVLRNDRIHLPRIDR